MANPRSRAKAITSNVGISNILIGLAMFISSYVPAFIALAIRFEPTRLRWVCVALAALGLLAAIWFMRRGKRDSTMRVVIKEAEDSGEDVASYLATYLLPFLISTCPSVTDLASYMVLFAAIGLVYVRTNMATVNPTLYALGYRRFRIVTEGGFRGYALSRRTLVPQAQFVVTQWRDIMFVRSEVNDDSGGEAAEVH